MIISTGAKQPFRNVQYKQIMNECDSGAKYLVERNVCVGEEATQTIYYCGGSDCRRGIQIPEYFRPSPFWSIFIHQRMYSRHLGEDMVRYR